MHTPPLRTVVVDGHTILPAGLRAGLGPAVSVVGEAATAAAAVPSILTADPDVVLLDAQLPDNGSEAVISRVAAERPGVRFLLIAAVGLPADLLAALRSGARGYVATPTTAEALVAAVHRAAGGHAVFSPWLAVVVLDAFRNPAVEPPEPDLDAWEEEVLLLTASGYGDGEISARLQVPAAAIDAHRSTVLRKLRAPERGSQGPTGVITDGAAARRSGGSVA